MPCFVISVTYKIKLLNQLDPWAILRIRSLKRPWIRNLALIFISVYLNYTILVTHSILAFCIYWLYHIDQLQQLFYSIFFKKNTCFFKLQITWLSEISLTSLIALFWNFPLIIFNFTLLFSHSKNIRMSTLITRIITYYLLIIIIIITKSHNNYCSVGVMESCILNLLISIDCFFCSSYPCVLFESLSHGIN